MYLRVDVTFGYLGFSYFIDKEMLNKIFMRVACAEMAFFFWKKKTSKPAVVLFDLVNPGRGIDIRV